MFSIEETIKIIKRGCAELISEDELREKLSCSSKKNPLRIKFGVDPTSPDLHLGHMVILNKLKTLQELGHKIIFIIGDFTARIGDPSGRSETRPMLDEKEILKNSKTYAEQVFKVLDKSKTEIVYNSSWLYPLGLQGMLELAKHATVAQMLHRADFKERYKNDIDITILEFLYPLIQGYDSVAIKADMEVGGTDQKFNLLMGREIQKKYGQKPQVLLTMPLLEGTDGVRKMSKSYGNDIAINEPPKEMFGKIMSISDEMMYKYYELLTEVDLTEVKKTHPRDAKFALAKMLVTRYYNKDIAESEAAEFNRVFKDRELPTSFEEFVLSQKEITLSELLYRSGLASSKSEARRLITQRAVKVYSGVTNTGSVITEDKKIAVNKDFIIQCGKKNFRKIIIKTDL